MAGASSLQISAVTSAGGPVTLSSLINIAPQNRNSIPIVKVKQERQDEAEIRELAAKMLEAQKAAMAKQAQQQQQQLYARYVNNNTQAGLPNLPTANGHQTNILNYVTRKGSQMSTLQPHVISNGNGKNQLNNENQNDSKKTCDEESQKGHFGWATFGKIHIPYIARQSEKYCGVRMVEMKLLNKYLSYLHPDIYSSCTCVRSYYITEAESRLLNEINHKHCDSQFGREMFTLKDLVVRLSDANKFYQFLDICYRKLLTGSKSPSDKCGFIRINKESVVPYTVRNLEQVVPLFYFEGETENLRQKADYLSGWDLAYLKFCCKVQGIRNELFSSESVAVISLADIKSYFPNGTEFEDYWPSKVVDSNLLVATKNIANSVHWTRQPTAPPPKIVPNPSIKSVPQQNRKLYPAGVQNARLHQQAPAIPGPQTGLTATVQALSNGWSLPNTQNNIPPGFIQTQTEHVFRMAAAQAQQTQRNYPTNRNQMQGIITGRQTYNYNNSGMPITATNCPQQQQQQQQQPPPLVRSTAQNQNHMTNVAAANAVLQLQQVQQQRVAQQNVMQNGRVSVNNNVPSAAMHLQRQVANTVTQQTIESNHRLVIIPEVPSGTVHVSPYKVQKVFVFENILVPCINMKAYNDSEQLMTLIDFRDYFFGSIPYDHCRRFIEAIGIDMYKGNSRQIQILRENGRKVNENTPLVQVRDIIKFMPQLRYMMRLQVNHEQPPSKRVRPS